MKKILLVTFCIISTQIFAQYKWSNPQKSSCYGGIFFSLVNYGKQAPGYLWGVKFTNKYSKPVRFSYKLIIGGESYPSGLAYWIKPGESHIDGGEMVTALLFKNSSTSYSLDIYEVCFDQEGGCYNKCYANCDKGSPNQPDCGKNGQTNTQANNNSQNSSSNGGGTANVQAKLDEIQVHIDKIPGDDSESQAIIRDATNIINNTSTSEQTKVNQLEPLLTRARNRANQLVTNKEKEDKAGSERDSNFKSYYEKGMANYSSKNYDGAINNLQTSLNYAVNDQQKIHVQDWIAKIREEKRLEAEAAARKARVDDKLKQEQQVNTEAAAATTVAVALFSILKDRYDERPVNLRFQVGLGLESIPIIVNDDFNKKSSFETTLHYSIMAGLKLGLFNQNGVSFHLNPVYYLGFNAGSQGTDGRHGTYGGIATLQMGLKAESVFKLYAEGGWLKRSGNYNYDQDAASGGTTASDLVEKGTYNYGLARFGGGIMLHFVNEPRETYIKGGIYFEKLSFASKSPQMVGSLQINISSTIILDFLYSKNYAIAGKADYPTTILTPLRSILPEEYNKSYFSVRLIRQGIF